MILQTLNILRRIRDNESLRDASLGICPIVQRIMECEGGMEPNSFGSVQKMLKEIMFVDLPDVGSEVVQMQPFASAESSKALSDVYSPVSGTVKAVNDDVIGDPGIINRDPYDAGWLVAIVPSNLEEDLKSLLSADAYKDLIKEKIR